MGYRKSKERVEADRNWSTFVARNGAVIEAAGLPQAVTESISRWDDFLMHGCLDHHEDATGFTADRLSDEQYAALLQLVESYFASGYEYYTPMALHTEDREWLEMRYGTG